MSIEASSKPDILPPAQISEEMESEDAVRIKEIDTCDFPIVEKDLNGYKVLVLPSSLKDYFDNERYHAVRINSPELAAKMPAFGGKTAASYSLLPHQDHFPTDKRRFLALSKENADERDSQTYLARPEVIARALPEMRAYLDTHRDALKQSFTYDPSMQLPKEVLLSCYGPGVLDKVVQANIGANADEALKAFAYAGIMAYLIQGADADAVVQNFLKTFEKEVVSEKWKRGGTLILDNSRVFHGRLGPNKTPLKRNWLVAE